MQNTFYFNDDFCNGSFSLSEPSLTPSPSSRSSTSLFHNNNNNPINNSVAVTTPSKYMVTTTTSPPPQMPATISTPILGSSPNDHTQENRSCSRESWGTARTLHLASEETLSSPPSTDGIQQTIAPSPPPPNLAPTTGSQGAFKATQQRLVEVQRRVRMEYAKCIERRQAALTFGSVMLSGIITSYVAFEIM